jgi:hypothetical protein
MSRPFFAIECGSCLPRRSATAARAGVPASCTVVSTRFASHDDHKSAGFDCDLPILLVARSSDTARSQ